ncbi:unnamed protein product [Ambrosiozyma monospora]|uniref:Unnamed protein product n=1 Tax=Ambrosiozyma monospora TaxID=43982 RepID=A0A9W6SXG7_AMBMO|nr:unnamed protein product [Ambrosiozyma monospora]
MVRLGLKVHPNTDDPILHHVDSTRSWEMMVECFDCSILDLKQFSLNGIEASWASESDKEKWRQLVISFFDGLL